MNNCSRKIALKVNPRFASWEYVKDSATSTKMLKTWSATYAAGMSFVGVMLSLLSVGKPYKFIKVTCSATTYIDVVTLYLFSSDSALGDGEMEDIYDFLVKNGLLYSKLYNRTNGTFLAASNYSYEVEAVSNKNCYGKRMYWTRSYDGCIENLLTGMVIARHTDLAIHIPIIYLGEVIALDDDQQNICLEHPNPEDEWQKWKINTKTGVILNRVTKTPLSSFSNGAPCLESNYLGRDCFQFIKPKESYTKFLSANYCSV